MECIKRVKTLPEDIVDHPHLRDATELDLSGSRLVTLPKRFPELKNLQTLDLRNCQSLVSLPEGFGELKKLEKLTLQFCHALRSLSEGFEQLTNLKELSMSECKSLTTLPAGEHTIISIYFI